MQDYRNKQALNMLKHRERVRSALPRIDAKPPDLDVMNFARMNRIKEDMDTVYKNRDVHMKLVEDVVKIVKTRGVINSFPENSVIFKSNVRYKLERNKQLEDDNLDLHNRLVTTTAETKTRRSDHSIHLRMRQTEPPFVVPYAILSKYSSLKLPVDELELSRLLRPCIFFDLEIKNLRPLGRIVIQLYTEAAPQVVLEFLRMCSAHNSEQLKFVRLFPSLWLEGMLKVDLSSKVNKEHEYDMRALDNNSGPGILSYSIDYIKGFKPGFFNFSISFKPLCVVNGRRIAFGRIISGMKVITCLDMYGTKNGRPVREVQIVKCGIMPPKQVENKKRFSIRPSARPSVKHPARQSIKRTSAEMKRMSVGPIKKLDKPATVRRMFGI